MTATAPGLMSPDAKASAAVLARLLAEIAADREAHSKSSADGYSQYVGSPYGGSAAISARVTFPVFAAFA